MNESPDSALFAHDAAMTQPVPTSIVDLAAAQHGVVSRRQLYRAGMTRWQVKAQLRARRWAAHGRQTVALHTGDLDDPALRWYAVFEAGPRAALDGHSALEAAGLSGWASEVIRVSVPRGAPAVRRRGLMVRQTRRLQRSDVISAGVPRVRPPIAAVRAALWARSNRQAATILAMTVQQRIATAESIGEALLDIKRDKRRKLLDRVVLDLLGGSQAMGELDFARLCRAHGLPVPRRQRVRTTPSGRRYLDAEWPEFGVVVEIDGIHHLAAAAVIDDAARHNDIALEGGTVLRIPVLGLRVAEAQFMAQVRSALVSGGWASVAS